MQIHLQPSATYRRLVLFSHLLVVLLILFSALSLPLTLLALVLCLVSFYLGETKRKSGLRYTVLSSRNEQFLVKEERPGESLHRDLFCQLTGETFSTPWLIVLKFKPISAEPANSEGSSVQSENNVFLNKYVSDKHLSNKKEITLVMFKDSMPAQDWRDLRVKLRTRPTGQRR